MIDILDRLRPYAEDAADLGATEEADIITRAADEIEWLRGERDRLAVDLSKANLDIIPWIGRVNRLTGENDRLRAALEQASEGLRDAGAIYGADAALAALGGVK